jgi:hypothetical protein
MVGWGVGVAPDELTIFDVGGAGPGLLCLFTMGRDLRRVGRQAPVVQPAVQPFGLLQPVVSTIGAPRTAQGLGPV